MRSSMLRCVSLLALASCAVASQAVVTTYTSLTAWQAAVGSAPTTLETFSTSRGSFANQTVGLSGFDLTSHADADRGTPSVSGGSLAAFVDGDGPTYLTFVPTATAFGFAGNFLSANSNEGTRVVLSTGESFDVGVNDGFFGFTSTTAFTSFDLVSRGRNGDPSFGEVFRLDNARFATSPVSSAVPGPVAALPFALMALKRRKRA